jgi:hypothetical protein
MIGIKDIIIEALYRKQLPQLLASSCAYVCKNSKSFFADAEEGRLNQTGSTLFTSFGAKLKLCEVPVRMLASSLILLGWQKPKRWRSVQEVCYIRLG